MAAAGHSGHDTSDALGWGLADGRNRKGQVGV